MIFFITSADRRLAPPAPDAPPDRGSGAYRVLPWWVLFPDGYKSLFAAVWEVVKSDPFCAEMIAAFEGAYRIRLDPDALLERLRLWCHPLVGNLMRSPRPRTSDFREQAEAWSALVGAGGSVAADVLERISGELGELPCNPIDECRIVRNLTELARAFIGDATSAPTLQIERLFALRLASSPTFHDAQSELLGRLIAAHGADLEGQIAASGFDHCEYCAFYLPELRAVPERMRVPMLYGLIGAARFDVWPVRGDERHMAALDETRKRVVFTWLSLPKVVACAALINDINKLNQRSRTGLRTLNFGATRARPNPSDGKRVGPITAKTPIEWGVEAPEKAQGLPDDPPEGVRWRGRAPLAWSWNRDEYSRSVMTYRVHLCPQWGGSSGHTTGALSYWLAAATPVCTFDALTVTTSLYVLWALCYDVRLSPVHRMVETLEETNHPTCAGCATAADAAVPAPKPPEPAPLFLRDARDSLMAFNRGGKYDAKLGAKAEDAWVLLLSFAQTTPRKLATIDTVRLVHALIDYWWPACSGDLRQLSQLLGAAADDLGSFAWLPDFQALSNRALVGLAVLPHAHPQSLWTVIEPTAASEMLARLLRPAEKETD